MDIVFLPALLLVFVYYTPWGVESQGKAPLFAKHIGVFGIPFHGENSATRACLEMEK
jgi:hypothetical protein